MFGKIGEFFKEVKGELKKVHWPSKNELSSYTLVVIITVVVLIAFIGVIDLAFTNVITPFIL